MFNRNKFTNLLLESLLRVKNQNLHNAEIRQQGCRGGGYGRGGGHGQGGGYGQALVWSSACPVNTEEFGYQGALGRDGDLPVSPALEDKDQGLQSTLAREITAGSGFD